MTKDDRLNALKKTLDDLLPEPLEHDARILLWKYITVYTIKKKHDNTGGKWKKAWYKLIGYPLAALGYIRDVRVNSTAGKFLFGEFAKFGTLTATLKRVKKSAMCQGSEDYITPSVGWDKCHLAVQICEVLNLYDPGHC